MFLELIFTTLILISTFVLASILGGEISKLLISLLGIDSGDSSSPMSESSMRHNLRKMIYSTKTWVATSTAVLSAVVYGVSGQASYAFGATILLHPALWYFAVKVVYPKSVGTNFASRFKEAMEGKFVSST